MIITTDDKVEKKSDFLTKTPAHKNSKVEKNCLLICSWICPGSISFPLKNQDRKQSKCSWVGVLASCQTKPRKPLNLLK